MAHLRYFRAIDDHRPFGAHRFDVFGLKIDRRLTLFGYEAMKLWQQLEFDGEVLSYCERPLRIPDTRPPRMIDFWVHGCNSDRFLILLSAAEERSPEVQSRRFAAFNAWATQQHVSLCLLAPHDFAVSGALDRNRARILQDAATARAFVTDDMKRRVLARCKEGATLCELESHLSPVDGTLMRAAAFMLLLEHRLHCPTLASAPLSGASRMVST
jgi:hypothetical protein